MKVSRLVVFLICCLVVALVVPAMVDAQRCDPANGRDCDDGGGGESDNDNSGGSNEGPSDSDSDGLPDGADRCPRASGPAQLGGCPDSDGDGTADDQDVCPNEGGPESQQGCPQPPPDGGGGEPGTDQTAPSGPQITFPDDAGRCLIRTIGPNAVNVRLFPSMIAAIVGTMQPNQLYVPAHIFMSQSGTWYQIANPAGFVSADVVETNGHPSCDDLPTSSFPNLTLDATPPTATAGAIPHWDEFGNLTFCLPNYEIGEETCEPDPEGPLQGAIPHWDELGNLTFCLPNYEIGEETCEPDPESPYQGAMPYWDEFGNLTFCLPNYEIGEETCVVYPQGAVPHWDELGNITFCLPDYEKGEETCVVSTFDPRDGGLILIPGYPTAPPEEPKWHKFLLVGDDGLLVLTAPMLPDDTSGPNADFPLWLALCPPSDEECEIVLHASRFTDPDPWIAACPFDDDKIIQCQTSDDSASSIPTETLALNFDDIEVLFMYYDPDLPIAACAFNDDLIIQCQPQNVPAGPVADSDFPIAACEYDPDELEPCDVPDVDDPNGPMPQTREHILLARQVGDPATSGDYNSDGVVDASDYAVWRSNYGAVGASNTDGDDTVELQIFLTPGQ